MLNTYIIFTKKRLAVVLMLFIAALLIFGEIYAAGNKNQDARTNAQRISFISSLGCETLSDTAAVKQVTIPTTFSDVYSNYNNLQKKSGYDLSDYKGCKATLYTYSIKTPQNYSGECALNILVYNNRVIGGDISSLELNGFMLPLKVIN